MILVPAAVGMRGNVFGALGEPARDGGAHGRVPLTARIDTRRSEPRPRWRCRWDSPSCSRSSPRASQSLSVWSTISIADFVVVSVVGGLIPIAVVMAITVGVTALSVRYDWDLDNVSAPVVTAAADSVTCRASSSRPVWPASTA